jgi:hypothetical protein
VTYNLIYALAAFLNLGTYRAYEIRRALYYLLLTFMFLFVALRWNVGCDFGSYDRLQRDFGPRPLLELATGTEPLFYLLLGILDRLGLDYPFLNIPASLAFFAGIHAIARRQPDRLIFLTLVFPILIIGIAMSATRQAIAIGFMCYAYNAFADRSRLRFVVFTVIAGMFHTSAFAFLALTPYIARNMSLIYTLGATALSVPLVAFMISTESAQSYINVYTNAAIGGEAEGGVYRTILIAATGTLFLLFMNNKWRVMFPADYRMALFFAPIMIGVFAITFYSSVIGDRFGYYLIPIQAIILGRAYFLFGKQLGLLVFLAPLTASGMALYVWSTNSWIFTLCYSNYRTWF